MIKCNVFCSDVDGDGSDMFVITISGSPIEQLRIEKQLFLERLKIDGCCEYVEVIKSYENIFENSEQFPDIANNCEIVIVVEIYNAVCSFEEIANDVGMII